MTSYDTLPFPDVHRLIYERIREIEKKGLNFGTIGPLHPRTMLYLLDALLQREALAQ